MGGWRECRYSCMQRKRVESENESAGGGLVPFLGLRRRRLRAAGWAGQDATCSTQSLIALRALCMRRGFSGPCTPGSSWASLTEKHQIAHHALGRTQCHADELRPIPNPNPDVPHIPDPPPPLTHHALGRVARHAQQARPRQLPRQLQWGWGGRMCGLSDAAAAEAGGAPFASQPIPTQTPTHPYD